MTNIFDVAKKAGVSIATISRVFNHTGIVKEETRQKVLKIANELDYSPSLVARTMRTSVSRFVCFILPKIDLPIFTRVIEGIEDYLYEKKYNLIIANIDNKIDRLKTQFDIFKNRKIDGIIYCSLGFSESELEILRNFTKSENIPLVFIDRILPELNFPYVVNDNFLGAYTASEYLISKGHKKIAVIYSTPEAYTTKKRLEGFKKSLKENKIPDNPDLYFIAKDISLKSGYDIAEAIFKNKLEATAIFCFTDILALGVLKYTHDNNISIPGKISLMGYDDIEFSALSYPPLTTIHQIKYKMGYDAAEIIIKSIELTKKSKNYKPRKKVILKPYLVERKSVLDIR